jgi:hypothetical protein
VTASYCPQGITRPKRGTPSRGQDVEGEARPGQIPPDLPPSRGQPVPGLVRASGAIEYRDLRNWLMYLADREAEASINPS